MVAYGTVQDTGLDFAAGSYTLYSFGPGGDTDCRSISPIKDDGVFFATIVGNDSGDVIGFSVVSESGLQYDLYSTVAFEPDATLADLELR